MAVTTVAATAGATLPGDVILEILARLEEASALVRCAATCRRWRALVVDPSFLRGIWPDRSFVGFFTSERRRREGASFVPGPRSALGAGRRLLSSYIPDAPDVSEWVQPLASHHGLLLVRIFPRDPGTMQLAVCDPLAGTWDVLPTLRVNDARYLLGYAIVAVTSVDCSSPSSPRPSDYSTSSFRVLLLTEDDGEDDYYGEQEDGEKCILHAFSSGEPSWSAAIKFPDNVENSLQGFTIAQGYAAVCRDGVAHWLFWKSTNLHLLHVNPETGRIASEQLVSPMTTRKLHGRIRLTTTADAALLSLCIYNGHGVQILEQQRLGSEDGTVRWICTKTFKLRLQLEGGRCMCLGARSGRMLIMDCHQRVFVVDLEGGAMEEMKDEFYDPWLIAVPMEINWPNFFMSRLRLV